MAKKQKVKKDDGRIVYTRISQAEYDQMAEIKKRLRFSVADQLRAGLRQVIKSNQIGG